ncbi:thioredoxin family (seleno)protein [Rubritalea tangerina]|uniref:Thioredoxin family (Seleno)protein n=1 Tax=Rubritalea tangerina TaxID=430798 RepID=A0ABW4ZFQ7_9BACT
MAHPIIVDAVEHSFIPLLVINNQASDKKTLQKFNEPAWNYQVVRFLDSQAQDILPRKDKIWSLEKLVPRMVAALNKSKQPIPPNLTLLAQELDTNNHGIAAFSQHCFWIGEAKLGAIKGVITTEAGWIGSNEVTLVRYHKPTIKLKSLINQAQNLHCANHIYLPKSPPSLTNTNSAYRELNLHTYKKAKNSDQKRQLKGTPYSKLSLTPAQSTKLNAYARTNQKAAHSFLTHEQKNSL